MINWYRLLAIAGIWMTQTAYGDVASSTGGQLAMEQDGPGPGASAKQDPYACVDTVLERLGIDLEMRTDPALIASILRDDMYLDDFPPVRVMFAESLAAPVALRPMLVRTRAAIVSR